MMSKDKIAAAVEDTLARETARYMAEHLLAELNSQWQTVVSELVATRKNNERLKEALNESEERSEQYMQTLADYKAYVEIQLRNQRKASELLQTATKEFGLSE